MSRCREGQKQGRKVVVALCSIQQPGARQNEAAQSATHEPDHQYPARRGSCALPHSARSRGVLTEAQGQSTKSKARQKGLTESAIDWKMPCARGTVIIVHANEHALAAHRAGRRTICPCGAVKEQQHGNEAAARAWNDLLVPRERSVSAEPVRIHGHRHLQR